MGLTALGAPRTLVQWVDRQLSRVRIWKRVRDSAGFRSALGFEPTIWTRKVVDREVRRLVAGLGPQALSALEISGTVWKGFSFRSYRHTRYPEFDVQCDLPAERFDLVIAEHVFEHLPRPVQAGRNVLAMLAPGGHLLVVTPFLYWVHNDPTDCTRWTETGLRDLLVESGFPGDGIVSGSWGNRACVEATFRREFRLFNRYLHSLRNEPQFPVVVWALARAPAADGNE